MDKKIEEVRNMIDKVDKQLVPLLVERINLAMEVIKYKSTEEEVHGKDRVQIVLDKVEKLAQKSGCHEKKVAKIYESIIKELTNLQLEIFYKNHPDL